MINSPRTRNKVALIAVLYLLSASLNILEDSQRKRPRSGIEINAQTIRYIDEKIIPPIFPKPGYPADANIAIIVSY